MIYVADAAITGGAGSTLEFTGLDGDADGIYHIEFSIHIVLTGQASLEFNDDNAGVARHALMNSTASTFTHTACVAGTSPDVLNGRIVVDARREIAGIARYRRYRTDVTWDAVVRLGASSIYSKAWTGTWQNTADNVTKLAIKSFSANGFGEGSVARLYRYPEA